MSSWLFLFSYVHVGWFSHEFFTNLFFILFYLVSERATLRSDSLYMCVIGRAKRAPHWGVQSRFRVTFHVLFCLFNHTTHKVNKKKKKNVFTFIGRAKQAPRVPLKSRFPRAWIYIAISVLPRIFLRDRGIFFLVVLTGFNHKMGGGQK